MSTTTNQTKKVVLLPNQIESIVSSISFLDRYSLFYKRLTSFHASKYFYEYLALQHDLHCYYSELVVNNFVADFYIIRSFLKSFRLLRISYLSMYPNSTGLFIVGLDLQISEFQQIRDYLESKMQAG